MGAFSTVFYCPEEFFPVRKMSFTENLKFLQPFQNFKIFQILSNFFPVVTWILYSKCPEEQYERKFLKKNHQFETTPRIWVKIFRTCRNSIVLSGETLWGENWNRKVLKFCLSSHIFSETEQKSCSRNVKYAFLCVQRNIMDRKNFWENFTYSYSGISA